jgi:hypothetical protein
MPLPGQMTENTLNAAKGWPHQAALDFQARMSNNVLYRMRAGQVGHINASGEIEPGVQLTQMGLFLFQGADSFDVNNQGNDQWTPIGPTGRIMCLVAEGAYELESTAFISTLAYQPNNLLRSPVGNTLADEFLSGMLRNDAIPLPLYGAAAPAIVGVVSRGVFTNAYGKRVIAFWPVYMAGNV